MLGRAVFPILLICALVSAQEDGCKGDRKHCANGETCCPGFRCVAWLQQCIPLSECHYPGEDCKGPGCCEEFSCEDGKCKGGFLSL